MNLDRGWAQRVHLANPCNNATHGGKPGGCPTPISFQGQGRPGKGRPGGQVVFTMLLDVYEELREELLGSNKPVTEDASYGQIVGQGLAESGHATAPGQGQAIVRRASRLTLA
jgi:hypothetical protein